MPLQKFFYPRLVYNSVTIDFPEPLAGIAPAPSDVSVVTRSLAGYTETLFQRIEHQIELNFRHLDSATLAALWTYWTTWAALGKQAALTLDRFNTCAGQWEYDQFNTFFTKAELVKQPFRARREVNGRTLYMIVLLFRQGP